MVYDMISCVINIIHLCCDVLRTVMFASNNGVKEMNEKLNK
jgi:hypothetical protein